MQFRLWLVVRKVTYLYQSGGYLTPRSGITTYCLGLGTGVHHTLSPGRDHNGGYEGAQMLELVLEAIAVLLAALAAFFGAIAALASMRASRAAETSAKLARDALKEAERSRDGLDVLLHGRPRA